MSEDNNTQPASPASDAPAPQPAPPSNLDNCDNALSGALAAIRREIASEAGDGVSPMAAVNHLQSFYNQVEALQRGIANWRKTQQK